MGVDAGMARYKTIDTSPGFLPVDLSRQLLPGTFESEVSVQANARMANVKRSGRTTAALLDSPLQRKVRRLVTQDANLTIRKFLFRFWTCHRSY